VAGDARADGEVSAATDEKLGNFRVHTLEVCQGVKDWRLPTDAVYVDIGPGVDIGTPVEEKTRTVEEAVFGGDVEERCATQGEQAAA
jgi:hypothetical protein